MRVLLTMVVFAYHSLFSVSLMSADNILAGTWFKLVQPPWVESLADDQYLGASIGWALGEYPRAIIFGALIWQWFRPDRAEQGDRTSVGSGTGCVVPVDMGGG